MQTITTTGDDYEYRGLMARYWDTLRGDTTHWDDQIFFRALALETGGPTLDVGCGSGRLLLDLLAHGVDIDGVDNSPEMLAVLREKAAAKGLSPTLYQQTMEALDLPRRYRTILVPSSSLQLLCDPEQAKAAVARLAAHLEPGGRLIAPFMLLWKPGDPLSGADETPRSATLPDGSIVRRWSRWSHDVDAGLESTEDLWERVVDGVVVESERHRRSPATRTYTQGDAVALFASAGLTDIRRLHRFTWEPATDDDTLFTLVGTKA